MTFEKCKDCGGTGCDKDLPFLDCETCSPFSTYVPLSAPEQEEPVAEKYDDTLLPFLALMRKELHANSHKGDREGWLGMSHGAALSEVQHHVHKLTNAITASSIKEHAADVANCCMMLLDVCGLLVEPRRVFGMNLEVDGNMPDDEMHLVGHAGEPIKLVVNDGEPENCRGLGLEHRWAPGAITGHEFCTKCGEMRGADNMSQADKLAYIQKFVGNTGKARDV